MEPKVQQKTEQLATVMGWSPAFAEGFVDGEACRHRGLSPSKYARVGIDEYSLGFRAGYFQRYQGPTHAVEAPVTIPTNVTNEPMLALAR